MRDKIVKFLERKIWETLHDFGFGSDFLNITSKAWATKEKIDKVDE
jgi:hypothetical protein